jgi:thiol-disulfide isomerase/thioredoxin
MRAWTGLVVTVMLGAATAVAAQRAPRAAGPHDPEMIDAQGFQKLLEHYRGEPLLVTFWATWCEPCRDEYPMLNELAKQYAPQGLRVVGVNLDDDGDLILMRRFLARYKPVFPNYRKTAGGEEAFRQSVFPGWGGAMPATFFYARDGRQVGHVFGEGKRETFESAIQSLVGSGSK